MPPAEWFGTSCAPSHEGCTRHACKQPATLVGAACGLPVVAAVLAEPETNQHKKLTCGGYSNRLHAPPPLSEAQPVCSFVRSLCVLLCAACVHVGPTARVRTPPLQPGRVCCVVRSLRAGCRDGQCGARACATLTVRIHAAFACATQHAQVADAQRQRWVHGRDAALLCFGPPLLLLLLALRGRWHLAEQACRPQGRGVRAGGAALSGGMSE